MEFGVRVKDQSGFLSNEDYREGPLSSIMESAACGRSVHSIVTAAMADWKQ